MIHRIDVNYLFFRNKFPLKFRVTGHQGKALLNSKFQKPSYSKRKNQAIVIF